MNTQDILKNRRSIRSYLEKAVEEDKLLKVIEAGKYAPTGMNRQSPVMVCVTDREVIGKMERINAEIMGNPDAKPFYGAPAVIIVFADTSCFTGFEDACLVMGNLLNGAYAEGLGSCWIHRAKETFETETGKALMKKWGLDERYRAVGNCIIGYAAEAPEARPRKEGYVIYDK